MDVPPRRPGVSKQQHVADVLLNMIETHVFEAGTQLPAEPDLERMFGYDRGTVRRGIALLRQAGIVETTQGRGTFVRQRRLVRHELLGILRTEYTHARNRTTPDRGIFEATTGVPIGQVHADIAYAYINADSDLSAAFNAEEGTKLLARTYAFRVDSRPHQITRSYLLAAMVEDTPLADPSNEQPGRGTLTQLEELDSMPDQITIDISARMPTPMETATLNIAEGTPLIVDRRRGIHEGQVVFVAETISPADQITIGLDINLDRL